MIRLVIKRVADFCTMGTMVLAFFIAGINIYPVYKNIKTKFVPSVGAISKNNLEPLPVELFGVHKIICIGDSITAATYTNRGYVRLLRDYLHAIYPKEVIEVENAGVNGNRSNDMLARFKEAVLDKKPDLVVINVGVNDINFGFDNRHPKGGGPDGVRLNVYLKNVESMLELAQSYHVKQLILSPTPLYLAPEKDQLILEYTEALERLAHRRAVRFVNLGDPFRAILTAYCQNLRMHEDILTCDGIHPNELGQRIIVNGLMNGLGISAVARQKLRIVD